MEKLSDYPLDPSFGFGVEIKDESEKPKKRAAFRLVKNQEKARAIEQARKPSYEKLVCECGFFAYFKVLFESHERVNHGKSFPKEEVKLSESESRAETYCSCEKSKEDFYGRPSAIVEDDGREVGPEEVPLGEMGEKA